MPDYGRDLNIGRPTVQNLTRYSEVQNFEKVIASIQAATHELEAATEELKKIVLGVGLTTGTDLNEEEA